MLDVACTLDVVPVASPPPWSVPAGGGEGGRGGSTPSQPAWFRSRFWLAVGEDEAPLCVSWICCSALVTSISAAPPWYWKATDFKSAQFSLVAMLATTLRWRSVGFVALLPAGTSRLSRFLVSDWATLV